LFFFLNSNVYLVSINSSSSSFSTGPSSDYSHLVIDIDIYFFVLILARIWKRWWSHNDVNDVVTFTPLNPDRRQSDGSIPES